MADCHDPHSGDCLLPLSMELVPPPDAVDVFQRLATRPHCLFLDSVMRDRQLGRYSFVTADPFSLLTVPADGRDGLSTLRIQLHQWQGETRAGLPPFQGGAAGLFSYDLNLSLERLTRPHIDEFGCPALVIGFYDVVVAFDHFEHRAWIVSQGFPELDQDARRQRAADRMEQFRRLLRSTHWPPEAPGCCAMTTANSGLTRDQLVPQFVMAEDPRLTSNFSRAGFEQAIGRGIEYIRAGDVFQVNLAQRLLYPAHGSAVDLYLRLRRCNPATFAAFFDCGPQQIVSASPERFLAVRAGQVEARPIKGTRQRCCLPEADLFAAGELLQSEKDRAENVMIVDLLRNDLSRVCHPDSVHVTDLCRLETYQYVQHLVSVVRGELVRGTTPLDLIEAAFPGGSITGAEKCGPCRSSANWNQPLAARIADRWATSGLTGPWT